VKCAECTDFDLCLQCFACGAEMGKHKRGHDYQLMVGHVITITGLFQVTSDRLPVSFVNKQFKEIENGCTFQNIPGVFD